MSNNINRVTASETMSSFSNNFSFFRRLGIHTDDYENIIELDVWLNCLYISSALFFILGLMGLSKKEKSKMGNFYAVIGMLIAIIGTFISPFVYGRGMWLFFVCCVPPSIIISVISSYIKMTSIPQLVALLNALGGLAATLESYALFFSPYEVKKQVAMQYGTNVQLKYIQFQVYQTVFYLAGASIGIITFSGSIVACLKLSNYLRGKPFIPPFRVIYMPLLILAICATAAITGVLGLDNKPVGVSCLAVMTFLSLTYGFLFVMAIGGADMPVVISVLNSGSGWSCVFTGITLQNSIMIIAGAFVGASGIILSFVMCRAMNRNMYTVLLGGFGDSEDNKSSDKYVGKVNICSISDVVSMLGTAKSVIIVPGYGLAVSRAQHDVQEFSSLLKQNNISVKFAIHPVAGRLPGHMNVLLAEANVPYDIVLSMEEINHEFKQTDIVFVIGANDTVNPAAENNPNCAIYGMPVLKVWEAKQTVVLKRSMNVGYAGVDNPLFVNDNNYMLLGDAKKSLSDINKEYRNYFSQSIDKSNSIIIDLNELAAGIKKSKICCSNLKSINGDDELEKRDKNFWVEENEKMSCSTRNTTHVSSTKYFNIAFLKEKENEGILEEEKRVAITPTFVRKFINKLNVGVYVESNAGIKANYTDDMYSDNGAIVTSDMKDIFNNSKILIKINGFKRNEINFFKKFNNDLGSSKEHKIFLCGFQDPANNKNLLNIIKEEISFTLFSLDVLPRITTAQKMDVLSSMAKLAGYRACIECMCEYNRTLSAEITAAGKYPPAKCLVIGTGVAGLQAIGTLRCMGADVRAFDIRLECKEQVESLGGKFLVLNFDDGGMNRSEGGYAKPMSEEFIKKEMELFGEQSEECNIFITTASIPGLRAPILLKKEHLDKMNYGSVVLDLAAATGGNVELTKVGETYLYNKKVTIIGKTDLTSRMAPQASEMFCTNIFNFIEHLGGGENFNLNMEDEIIKYVTLVNKGCVLYPQPKPLVPISINTSSNNNALQNCIKNNETKESLFNYFLKKLFYRYYDIFSLFDLLIIAIIALLTSLFAITSPPSFSPLLFIFVLSCYVGYLLVWNVDSSLHTPLMSVTNAISGVVLVGGMLGISEKAYESFEYLTECINFPTIPNNDQLFYCRQRGLTSTILNCMAIVIASINVFGGFVVTQRMLNMFKKSK